MYRHSWPALPFRKDARLAAARPRAPSAAPDQCRNRCHLGSGQAASTPDPSANRTHDRGQGHATAPQQTIIKGAAISVASTPP